MTLARNDQMKRRMIGLIASESIAGKVTEEDFRLEILREILRKLTLGEYNIHTAIRAVSRELSRDTSIHSHDNRVFPSGWDERLIRTQYSRFYNQAVLQDILDGGVDACFVPTSKSQQAHTNCSVDIAGRTHDAKELLDNLASSYGDGDWSKSKKIPEHPHCTHVVRPILED